ncbi:MAG TPA: histidine phosphatase family protein [Blastocatellia bacterium]|nr:histidine phosphatase family protein [Blastocatellia bacterium]
MSLIYLIRHAQAGTRENYDVLSELGHEQARLVGEYLVSQEINLTAVYSGNMRRQQHTAELACSAYARGNLLPPEILVDARWDEFSLGSVYRSLARRLMDESPEFAQDFQEMQEALRRDPHTTRGATGRCDAAVIRAWVDNRFPDFEGELWGSFRGRIQNCFADLLANDSEQTIAVFTSATPIAIMVGAALELSDDKLLSILGVIYNTSVSIIRARPNDLRLFTFNMVPHLNNSLRSFR